MKKILIWLIALGSFSAFSCECFSDYGYIIKGQEAKIKNMLNAEELNVESTTGRLSVLAYLDKNTYLSSCGCSKYYITNVTLNFLDSERECSAEVEIKNWNSKVKVKHLTCD